MFTEKFASIIETPFSLKEKSGPFELRYHPKRRRWSCTCQDFKYRRQDLADDHPDKNCKHIQARLEGSTPAAIRARTMADKGIKKKVESVVLNVFR